MQAVESQSGAEREDTAGCFTSDDQALDANFSPQHGTRLPSWLGSVVVHLALLLALALTFQGKVVPPPPEPARTAEIVLKRPIDATPTDLQADTFISAEAGHRVASKIVLEDSANAAQKSTANLAADSDLVSTDAAGLPSGDPRLAFQPGGIANGKNTNAIGPGKAATGLGVGGMLSGSGRRGYIAGSDPDVEYAVPEYVRPAPTGPPAQAKIFGATASGHRFVFVIDRSKSMGPAMRNVLEAAKDELIACLSELRPNHEFQIVFYNERPTRFGNGRLTAATPGAIESAKAHVRAIHAEGTTQHDAAIATALEFAPDVIFLLTDAEPPALNAYQLGLVRQRAAGRITIQAIEFSVGPSMHEVNFLKQIAADNGGKYTNVDVTKPLPRLGRKP